MYNDYKAGKANEHNQTVMEFSLIGDREIKTVPMSLLVQLGSIVDFNVPMMETVFEKIGTPYKYEDFDTRLERAKYWLYQCAPESANKLRGWRDWDLYNTFTEEEKKEIEILYDLSRQVNMTWTLSTRNCMISRRKYTVWIERI